jgi:hypothetical protein
MQIKALLDLELLANFISSTAVLRARLKPYCKQTPYSLYIANRERILTKLGILYTVNTELNI